MPKYSETRKQLVDSMMKDAVYQAAVSVLLEHGVEGMTVDRVAAATHVAKATLYNYFPNKRALFELISVRTISPILAALETIAVSDRPVLEKLDLQLRTLVDDAADRLTLLTFLLRDESVRGLVHSSDWKVREDFVRHIAPVFQQGIDEGVFRATDALGLARMFFGAWNELLHHWVQQGGLGDKDATVWMILDTFLRGIVADASRATIAINEPREKNNRW
jgi:AcrR family transcriptional regulator